MFPDIACSPRRLGRHPYAHVLNLLLNKLESHEMSREDGLQNPPPKFGRAENISRVLRIDDCWIKCCLIKTRYDRKKTDQIL
jgi:hypothetical protein